MSDCVPKCIEMLEIQNRNSEQYQTTITFYLDVRLCPVVYRDARNSEQKLWGKSIDNNFLVGGPIVSRCISRLSKFRTEALCKIKTIITFYSDVRLCPVVYRDARNSEQKLWGKSIDNTFLLGGPIVSHCISRRSKFRTKALSKINRQ